MNMLVGVCKHGLEDDSNNEFAVKGTIAYIIWTNDIEWRSQISPQELKDVGCTLGLSIRIQYLVYIMYT